MKQQDKETAKTGIVMEVAMNSDYTFTLTVPNVTACVLASVLKPLCKGFAQIPSYRLLSGAKDAEAGDEE